MEKIVLCIPVFNDWESAARLIPDIDRVCGRLSCAAELLVVDDGSTEAPPADFARGVARLQRVEILRLRRNVGHQRAIAVGLAFIHQHRPCAGVLVMDGDGEDSPNDIPRLLDKFNEGQGKRLVFAKRRRRAEGLLFQVLYRIFRAVHRVLTGRKVEVGNFSVIPSEQLNRLVVVSETWNHYAAAVFNARIPFDMVPADRARRIAGASKMNFVELFIHGLSAMSVFASIVGVRLLLATFILALLTSAGLLGVVVARLFTDLAIPGWATVAAGCLMIILLQAFLMSLVFVFVALHGRASPTFIPIRDYIYFVQEVEQVIPDV